MFVNRINKYNDVLQFIELCRSHEVLWNMNIPSYRRNDLKIKAYNYIAAETKLSVEEVKRKIKSFRTSYCAEKAKIESSKKSGCATENVYTPSVFWFNEMSFLGASLIRRKTVDNSYQIENSNQADFSTINETSLDSEPSDATSSQKENFSTPSSSKKRKHAPEPKSKLDDALEKIIAINKDVTVFETFGESVGKQVKEFPEEDAYEVMAEIQAIISKRKVDVIRKKSLCIPPRTSTPLSQSSSSVPSSDVLFYAISDAEIKEEEC